MAQVVIMGSNEHEKGFADQFIYRHFRIIRHRFKIFDDMFFEFDGHGGSGKIFGAQFVFIHLSES